MLFTVYRLFIVKLTVDPSPVSNVVAPRVAGINLPLADTQLKVCFPVGAAVTKSTSVNKLILEFSFAISFQPPESAKYALAEPVTTANAP